MPLLVIALVLFSAMVHASWNAVLKRSRAPESAMVAMMATAALSSAAVALVLRTPLPPPRSLAFCLVAGVLEAGYFVTLPRALARAPLGPVYTTVRGGALVVVWPLTLTVLGERMTPWAAGGTLLVVLGLAVTGLGQRSLVVGAPTTLEATAQRAKVASGMTWASICALFVGGYHVSYKVALASGGEAVMVVAISMCAASAVHVATLGRGARIRALEIARAERGLVLLGGGLAAIGFIAFLAAMKDAGAGIVLTLRNTSILFAQLLALLQGESPRRSGWIGAVFVMAGAVLLAR